MAEADVDEQAAGARRELRVFLFLTIVLAPMLAFGIVAFYGFVVWMSQLLIFGPPTG